MRVLRVWISVAALALSSAAFSQAQPGGNAYIPGCGAMPPGTVCGNSTGSTAAPVALSTLVGITISCAANTFTGLQSLCKLVDVMAAGAKCDGTTDDTVVIQSAINSLTIGYGTVIFPDAKTCKITSTITVTKNGVVLQGANEYSTFIDFEPSVTIGTLSILNTTGNFSCAGCSGLVVGETITGTSITWAGSGSITGYSSPTQYVISATNGTTTLTLKALALSSMVSPLAIATVCASPPCAATGGTWALAGITAFRFAGPTGAFNASTATNVLTLTSTATGTFALGQLLVGAGVAGNTTINTLLTGSLGVSGSTYRLSTSPGTIGAEAMTSGTELFDDGFMDMSVTSFNSTYTKTAIETIDTSVFNLRNVTVGPNGVLWTGGAAIGPDTQAGSIALRTRGRENYLFELFATQADRSVVISANPNALNTVEDCNECHFFNLYLGATGNNIGPNVWIDDGVAISATVFDGFQAWVGGTYGVYYNNTLGTSASYSNSFSNVVWEQNTGTSGYAFYFNENSSGAQFQQLSINNATMQTTANGIYLVGCHFCDIRDSTYLNATGTFITLTANDYNVSWESLQIASGATATLTGQIIVDAIYSADNLTVPGWVHLAHSGQVPIPLYGYGAGTVNTTNLFLGGYGGASFTAVGTGGCSAPATFSGGNLAGSFTCSSTAAGTATLTFAAPNPSHSYTCNARNVTTGANLVVQTGAKATTTATFTFTTGTSADVIEFHCIGY